MKHQNKINLFLRFCAGILLAVLFLQTGLAQETKQSLPPKNKPLTLDVTVKNKEGGWIVGLLAENFRIYDEKKLQTITSFQYADEPLSIGILFDKSASAKSTRYFFAQRALKQFVKMGKPENEYFLMTFNETQQLILDNTQDGIAVSQAIEKLSVIPSEGNTKFIDSAIAALNKLSKSKYTKRVLFVVTDGQENESKNGFSKIKTALKRTDVLFYAAAIFEGGDYAGDENARASAYLEELAGISGGACLYPDSEGEIYEVFARIADELRSQYTISYQPSETTKTDDKEKWHKLKVEVEVPPGANKIGKLQVRTREGYYQNLESIE